MMVWRTALPPSHQVKLLEVRRNLKVIGRAGIGTDNVDKEAASKGWYHRHEHTVR
jgi:phosphoglycerate dehydrogenase-like enzyme